MKIFIDASTNPKTKRSGVGLIAYLNNGNITSFSIPLLCHYNNHEAEFIALIISLNYLYTIQPSENVFIYSDSQTVVNAMNHQHIHHTNLKELTYIAQQRQNRINHLFLNWIPEKQNKKADELARRACYLPQESHPLNYDQF